MNRSINKVQQFIDEFHNSDYEPYIHFRYLQLAFKQCGYDLSFTNDKRYDIDLRLEKEIPMHIYAETMKVLERVFRDNQIVPLLGTISYIERIDKKTPEDVAQVMELELQDGKTIQNIADCFAKLSLEYTQKMYEDGEPYADALSQIYAAFNIIIADTVYYAYRKEEEETRQQRKGNVFIDYDAVDDGYVTEMNLEIPSFMERNQVPVTTEIDDELKITIIDLKNHINDLGNLLHNMEQYQQETEMEM